MKLTHYLIALLACLFITPSYAVGTSVQKESLKASTSLTITGQSNASATDGFFSKISQKISSAKMWVAKKLAKSGLLDNPKRILIFAALAFVGALALTLIGILISIGFLSTLAWILYLVSFALVVLWLYTVLIRN